MPSIWRGRIAFFRRTESRQPELRRGSLTSNRTARVPGRFPGSSDDNRHPESLDLRGARLGVVWTYLDDRRGCPDDDSLRLDPLRSYVYEAVGGSRPVLRASGCKTTSDASRVSGAGFLPDGRFFWNAERYDLTRGLVTAARVVTRTSSGHLTQGPERLLPGTYSSLLSGTPFGTSVLANVGASFVTLELG